MGDIIRPIVLSLTLTVLEENEESLLAGLALIACTGHWVHLGHRGKYLPERSILALSIVFAFDIRCTGITYWCMHMYFVFALRVHSKLFQK